jgi:hypothetical protein
VNQANRVPKTYCSEPQTGGDFRTNPIGQTSSLTALSVEFVAKPEEAREAEHAIPTAIDGSLREVGGYAGCLVMVSNQEARLITVVTFWTGANRAQRCNENARWVFALLKPYMDRCLRSQTVFARVPMEAALLSMLKEQESCNPETELEMESATLSMA